MHIPDGFLSGQAATAAGVLALGAVGVALRRTRHRLPSRKTPLMGLAAAFVFAAQMLNFPVGGGTSGHLVGGVLCAVLLGPSAALLVIACVLIVQCFVFADGGVLALGANVFNMGVVAAVGGYYVYRAVYKVLPNRRGHLVAIAFASWLSTVLASVACAGELAISGTASWRLAFPAMTGVHALIGAGEAVITTLVVVGILRTRPELVHADARPAPGDYREFIAYGALVALGFAVFVSPFACPWPDGLDRVADLLGFKSLASSHSTVPSPIPDYAFPGVQSPALATSIAGAIGTVVAFMLAMLFARVLIPARLASDAARDPGPGDA